MEKFIKTLFETIKILMIIVGIVLLIYIPIKILTYFWWWTIFIFLGLAVLALFYTVWETEKIWKK